MGFVFFFSFSKKNLVIAALVLKQKLNCGIAVACAVQMRLNGHNELFWTEEMAAVGSTFL